MDLPHGSADALVQRLRDTLAARADEPSDVLVHERSVPAQPPSLGVLRPHLPAALARALIDQGITQQASDAFGELIRRYPESRYAADARLKVDLINDHLAGKEMEVGRFYQRQGNWLAATIRFRTVVDKFQSTSHTPEALERLVESYLALGVPAEAKKAAAVLGSNYPGTKWYKHSYELIQRYAPQS